MGKVTNNNKEWVDIIKGDFDDYQIELEKSTAEKNFMALKAIANKLKKQFFIMIKMQRDNRLRILLK